MSLIARIEEELKAARLARDEDRRDALSLVLNALQGAQKELQRPLSDDEELQVLQRERKRRVEAAEAFRAAGREEQAEDEEYELEILEEFMPEPMSEDGDRGDHRRRHLRGRRDEHPRHGSGDGRRHAPGLRPRRRLDRLQLVKEKLRLTPRRAPTLPR